MQVPLEITFHDVDRSEWSENFIRRQVQRLERYAPDMISCRVTVALPHQRHHTGNAYRALVEVTLAPNLLLAASAEPRQLDQKTELRTTIRDAFHSMEQQIKKAVDKRRYDIKHHDEPTAMVVRLFPDEGYGFLMNDSGEEIYFHRNSVLNNDFERLTIGTEVRWNGEEGEQGPQASSVQVVSKPGVRAGTGPGGDQPRRLE